MSLLAGKVAIVSGVGPGTGRAIALSFAHAGADLVLTARHEHSYAAVAGEIEALGRRAVCVSADICAPEDRRRIVERALDVYGRVDVLANNAFALGRVEPIETADLEASWRTPFKVNLFGTLAMTQAVVPAMKRSGGGAIVMIASMAARKAEPGMAAYGASKAALMYSVRALATELGPHRIRVNCVVPSHIDGPNLRAYFRMQAETRGVSEETIYRETAALGVLPHVCTAEEVASVVTFFASDHASAVTGQSLDVNCGQWFD